MKRYKYQALVTLHPVRDGTPQIELGTDPRRMVVRALNEETQRSQVFSALVSSDDDGRPIRRGSHQVVVTLRLAGDDVRDYLDVGGRFELWLGSDIGEGVVTRRLFV
jgi:hypothetical protein